MVRNFSIIAHIDHGKSTLADRLLELTGTIDPRQMRDQVLDRMDLERERGITIKAQAVRMLYQAQDGHLYTLNLIDTPGHVDFSYEVSRSLAACEGALLVIDATQGVEAQTLANLALAQENHLTIVPVINKIDLPSADVAGVKRQIKEIIGLDPQEALLVSAKEGIGIQAVLEAVVQRIPPPKGEATAPLQALIFDSWFDSYQGAVILVRVFAGTVRKGTSIRMMSSGKEFEVSGVGIFVPQTTPVEELSAGAVGYLTAGIKHVRDTRIGDTVTCAQRPAPIPLPGFREPKSMVFCGLYPVQGDHYGLLREALERLQLNDSAFHYEPETSLALGFGFRCGFLGLLHMEIVRERLEREFGLTLLTTSPTVVYLVTCSDGGVLRVDNPAKLPPAQMIRQMEEPIILGTIVVPHTYLGGVLQLAQEKRGMQRGMEYLTSSKVRLAYEFPLNEIIADYYDKLKSVSKGYASFDYEFLCYRPADLVKLDILVNGEPVDALSCITIREEAYHQGRELVERMRGLIPRQLFEVVIQAAIGSKVIARETVQPLRKHVTAKCYGGDITRKRKLLERQKEGKKRMKRVGRVEIPQEVFMVAMHRDRSS